MKKDKHITEVIFRDWQSTDFNIIIALFPYETNRTNNFCLSYEHTGQHSDADYDGVIKGSVPAKEQDYKALKSELQSLGYNLKVIKKRNYTRYLKAYYEIRND